MNVTQIEERVKLLSKEVYDDSFIYRLLECYFLPKASISRLKKGSLNLSKAPEEVSWKKKVLFREEKQRDLHLTISSLKSELKHSQRFVIVTDGKTILAIDNHTEDRLDVGISELSKYYDFFLPWAGMEKAVHAAENPADVKAAEKMAKLFDEIKKDNPDTSKEFTHNLNIFFSRLLFCYFAEDTNIFEDDQFSNAIQSHTSADGSDLNTYLERLFAILDTPEDKRGEIPHYLDSFPYVNGGLFKEKINCPKFTSKSRQLLIESGDTNDWSAINPDIFGSMFQAVITPEHRGGLGAHYTSVPNIMKVIDPLFLNDLKAEVENAIGNKKKLNELLHRISKIKIFDPACGSGNFLIIAYKELRHLEMRILKELGGLALSGIQLNNFYGIELDDFAHEIAKLSLWLAEHQLNVEFFNEFGRTNPTLPLQEAGQIICGNACRLDWEKICPKNEGDEIYILGNPPYLGARVQNQIQKEDLDIVFDGFSTYRDLDYIACWFYKGSNYIKGIFAELAFVSTNSICQGLQVGLLWPHIFQNNIEISFAHTSFKWQNNASQNAAVVVVIIGLSNENSNTKILYDGNLSKNVKSINAYLAEGSKTFILRRSRPLSFHYEMSFGNMPNDGGGLIIDGRLKEVILNENPNFEKYIKNFVGAAEFIQGHQRYCLWIRKEQYSDAIRSKTIIERIEISRNHRVKSKDKGTNRLAQRPYQFRDIKEPKATQIIVPSVSSERREYVPIGFLNTDSVISNSAQAIYDAEPWLLSVLTSKIHMIWLHNIGGKLKSDYRYAKDIVYNTFPFPPISNERKEELTQCTFRILEEREKHSEKTLAELYDPDKMPEGLKEVHRLNDEAVEHCYRSTPFKRDEERLEYLFKLYEKMIQEEKEKGTLFEVEKKKRKKK